MVGRILAILRAESPEARTWLAEHQQATAVVFPTANGWLTWLKDMLTGEAAEARQDELGNVNQFTPYQRVD